jgi:hypothetical protein
MPALPDRTVSAYARAAQLRADGISSCCYLVTAYRTNRHDQEHAGQAGAASPWSPLRAGFFLRLSIVSGKTCIA